MTDSLIREYYASQVQNEWRRLVRDAYHRLEFLTTLHYLEKYLPKQGLILDAGGGPGRYTLELAKRGYEMVLLDATQANLDFARRQVKRTKLEKKVREFTLGSIVDLSRYHDETFEAVICTGGPLSHVLDPSDRVTATGELMRVVKPGAPMFVSVIGRMAVLAYILTSSQDEIAEPHFQLLCDTGDYLGGYGFTACHFYLPEELRKEFAGDGLEILEMVGLEGISSLHGRDFNKLAKDKNRYQIWLETHFKTCTHPAVVGISEHILIACRKSAVMHQ